MNRAVRNLEQFARRVENTGRELTARLSVPLVGVGAVAIKAAADFEKFEKSLEAITGSTEEAQEQLERLQAIARLPGIALEQAIQGSTRLQSVGFAAREAEATLIAFSKAVTLSGGNAEDLDQVIRQITQINSKGRILAEDFLVIAERIPSIGIALQEAFGTTNIEAIRATGISAGEFTARLVQGIEASREFQDVQGGLSNSFDNFRQSVVQSLATLGKAITESIDLQGILDKLAGVVRRAAQAFDNLSPATKRAIVVASALAAAVGPGLIALGSLAKILPIVTTGIKAFGVTGAASLGAFAGISFAIADLTAEFGSLDKALAFVSAKFAKLGAIGKEVLTIFAEATSGPAGIAALLSQGSVVDRITSAGNAAFEQSLRASALAQSFSAGRQQAQAPDFGSNFDSLMSKVNAGMSEDAGLPAAVERLAAAAKIPELAMLPTTMAKIVESNAVASDSLQSLGASTNFVSVETQRMTEQFQQAQMTAILFSEQLNSIVKSGVADFAASFGESVAGLVSGSVSIQGALTGLLDSLLGILERLGKLAISTGVALLGIQTALKSLNPGVAIAAGAALIGLVKLVRSTLKNIAAPFAEGGLVFGPTLGLVGEGPGTTRSNPEVIAPLDKLRGMIGGASDVRVQGRFELDGSTLVAAFDTANRDNQRRGGPVYLKR